MRLASKILSKLYFNKPKKVADTNGYKSVIDSETRRRKTNVRKIGFEDGKEVWGLNGKEVQEYNKRYILRDLELVKNFFKSNQIDVMILGPGKGAEVIYFKKLLKGMTNNIDTVGLTNYLSQDAKKVVRNDYSPKSLSDKEYFEHSNHLKFVNKYNYIYSYFGPGVHTSYPEIVILKAASMLKPGGIARICVSEQGSSKKVLKHIKEYIKLKKMDGNIKLKSDHYWIIIRRIK